jgi:hypothetical protein
VVKYLPSKYEALRSNLTLSKNTHRIVNTLKYKGNANVNEIEIVLHHSQDGYHYEHNNKCC